MTAESQKGSLENYWQHVWFSQEYGMGVYCLHSASDDSLNEGTFYERDFWTDI